MIRRLQRRLALAAVVAHRLEGAFIALGANGATVLDDNPHATFHLAAAAAAGTHALGVARLACSDGARLGQRGARGRNNGSGGRGGGGQLRERATRHRKLAHASPPSLVFSTKPTIPGEMRGANRVREPISPYRAKDMTCAELGFCEFAKIGAFPAGEAYL